MTPPLHVSRGNPNWSFTALKAALPSGKGDKNWCFFPWQETNLSRSSSPTHQSQPRCQMQTGSEVRESKKSLNLWLWVPTHSASCAQMTDIRCFWKMEYLSFYDRSVISTVPCQDSLLLVSFPKRGQHLRCFCHFKHSLMPSFFLCAFYEKGLPAFFSPLASHCIGYHSGLQNPEFLSCVLLASPVQPSLYYKH